MKIFFYEPDALVRTIHNSSVIWATSTRSGRAPATTRASYVDDLVDGLIALMDSADEITGPINLGNPTEFTMLELAEQVVKLTGTRSKIEFRELPQDDPKQRQPDIALAKRQLKWAPQVALEAGLPRTIEYFSGVVRR